MLAKSLYPKLNLTSVYGNSTKIFKLLMHVNDQEFNLLNDYVRMQEDDKFKKYSEILLDKYQKEISESYLNPAVCRIKMTEKLIPLDFSFLRSIAIAEL